MGESAPILKVQKAYLTGVKVKIENQKSIGIIKILIKETIFFGFN
ncbi:MAG: hypothetical protein ACTSVF_02390 [Candidatus Asgardarchaeia archaeon]